MVKFEQIDIITPKKLDEFKSKWMQGIEDSDKTISYELFGNIQTYDRWNFYLRNNIITVAYTLEKDNNHLKQKEHYFIVYNGDFLEYDPPTKTVFDLDIFKYKTQDHIVKRLRRE